MKKQQRKGKKMRGGRFFITYLSLVALIISNFAFIKINSAQAVGPIVINSCEELQLIGNDVAYPLSGEFILGGDIDCSATDPWGWDDELGEIYSPVAPWLSENGFYPLGSSTPFSGVFDGAGYEIQGLYIDRSDFHVGLFAQVSGLIKNVKLTSASIYSYPGSDGEEIVDYTGMSAGALAAHLLEGGRIENSGVFESYLDGRLHYLGGLVGFSQGTIDNCYAENISIDSEADVAGGLVGRSVGNIENSWSSGYVNFYGGDNEDSSGGLVGTLGSGSSIRNSTSTVNISGKSVIGGLVGRAGGNIYNSEASGQVTGTGYYIGGLVGYLSGQIRNSSASGETQVSEGAFAGGLVGASEGGDIYDSHATGIVSAGSISASSQVGGLVGDSNGKIIRSYATGEVIAHRSEKVGGLAGAFSGLMEDSYSTNVVGGNTKVGGLVGHLSSGTINRSYSVGTVSGGSSSSNEEVGGLVGRSENSAINYSFTNSLINAIDRTLNAGDFFGGAIGYYLPAEEGQISEVYWFAFDEYTADYGSYVYPYSINCYYQAEPGSEGCTAITSSLAYFHSLENTPMSSWDFAEVWQENLNAYPTLLPQTEADEDGDDSGDDSGDEDGEGSNDGSDTPAPNISSGSSPISLPGGTGSGTSQVSLAPGTSIGTPLNVGEINSGGVNVLTYISSPNHFSAPESGRAWQSTSHHFTITGLDLFHNIATLTFYSEPKTVSLKLGETTRVDLDGDNIFDIEATFSSLFVNRAEITIKSLVRQTDSSDSRPSYSETLNRAQVIAEAKAAFVKQDKALTSRLLGRILLQVDNDGQAWYLEPVSAKRHFLGRPADAFALMRHFGLGVSDQDMSRFIAQGAPQRLSGRILLAVESNGEAYYVNPIDLKLHYLGRPADAFNLMRELALGINNANLNLLTVSENISD